MLTIMQLIIPPIGNSLILQYPMNALALIIYATDQHFNWLKKKDLCVLFFCVCMKQKETERERENERGLKWDHNSSYATL